MEQLIIKIKHGGLGDHLFYSHIPRIAKESGKYNKVFISNQSDFRNKDYKKLVWEFNKFNFLPRFAIKFNQTNNASWLTKIVFEIDNWKLHLCC